MNELIKVEITNNNIAVSSVEVAKNFGKEHKHILRDVESLKDVSNFGQMFLEDSYQDTYGRNQKCYLLNRDGFSLLAMGFTGEKALSWKIKYINAFNAMEAELNTPEKLMARALKVADETINNLKLENKVKDQQIAELKPKATYYDLILQNKDLLSMTAIAKDYGRSATSFNSLLHDLGIQYKQSKVWFLYQKYADKGYTSTKTHTFSKSNGDIGSSVHTYWTQKGRLFLYHFLKGEGIYPLIELEE